MKALSGYAEWFWLMAKNIKPVENRSWSLLRYFRPKDLPVRVYLHASKKKTPKSEMDFIKRTLSREQLKDFEAVDFNALRGKIIGEITITGEEGISYYATFPNPWAFGPFCFAVKKGKLYNKPIPMKGQLGFFNVTLPQH